ncbi:hypothetical protein BH10BAC2_BH10BAC2_48630 [soil metagenome]
MSIVLEYHNEQGNIRKLECREEDYGKDMAYDSINYYLTQELNRVGLRTDENLFTKKEKDEYESKLDKIL